MRELIPYAAVLSGPLTVVGIIVSTVGMIRYRLSKKAEHR